MRALVFLLFFLSTRSVVAASANANSAREILVVHGFPPGLLPDDVDAYSLDEDGHFFVQLKCKCDTKVGHGTEVYYAPIIRGILKGGVLSSLTGITTKLTFFWLPVTSIYVDAPSTGLIHFRVGLVSKAMQVDEFSKPPNCGNCDGANRSTSWWNDLATWLASFVKCDHSKDADMSAARVDII